MYIQVIIPTSLIIQAYDNEIDHVLCAPLSICFPRAYINLHWHTGGSSVHVIEIKHNRVRRPTRMKPSPQVCVANVPILKSGVKSGKYVIAPLAMGGSAGHCAVKENNL